MIKDKWFNTLANFTRANCQKVRINETLDLSFSSVNVTGNTYSAVYTVPENMEDVRLLQLIDSNGDVITENAVSDMPSGDFIRVRHAITFKEAT